MSDTILTALRAALGDAQVLTGADAEPWSRDWSGQYRWTPLCVARPVSTQEVSAVMRIAHETATPVVPVGGNTGLAGGTSGEGAIMLSLARMNRIREIRPQARIAVVEAGVVLSTLHDAAAAQDLLFPLTFGARGSTMVGGFLSTNAGGSNVLRYGNTRDLVLGIEAVLADGRVMDLMGALHKDNSGLNLKHLLIGAEGTLAVITGAVLKLVPRPRAYATAMVAVGGLDAALSLLNALQAATGGAVEAFEYMPRGYLEAWGAHFPDRRPPFDTAYEVSVLVEVGAIAARDAEPGPDGTAPVMDHLEDVLNAFAARGEVLDAIVAQTESQRAEMWTRREAAGEVSLSSPFAVNNDIAVPLDKVAVFLERMDARLSQLDPAARPVVVSHLGDGNVHYAVWASGRDMMAPVMEAVEDEVLALGGSFSAEHGIGLTKLPSMARRKDKVALAAMQAIKTALDPKGILNPGKVYPE
ncbi:FAD-binding oxidoreductase [Puniceibacterium sp. IMCC21224]|uniref:FAD-binding oxidoreductase n=1 Tax=Puniceibacterium sp. IMCC21224 TaxID=1618204 RepID=UPI00064D7FD8|nr:FAD-binding oxidoreductase [Puniceibacterium sp. IMCC21224]KMK68149.1 FAD/FMN-dependent dehydrogenase [Puniceibacterium sp. IMCC21224]